VGVGVRVGVRVVVFNVCGARLVAVLNAARALIRRWVTDGFGVMGSFVLVGRVKCLPWL
jgi:hypothetical protein